MQHRTLTAFATVAFALLVVAASANLLRHGADMAHRASIAHTSACEAIQGSNATTEANAAPCE